MTKHASPSGKRRGCGPLLVAMIAVFFLSLGVFAGAGGLYYYASDADGAERLGLGSTDVVTEQILDLDDVYPLAYPLVETLSVPSAVDEEQMRDHLRSERFALKECYIEELERSPTTRGELDVQFSVSGSNGEVVAAVTRNNHTGSEELSDCVLDVIRQDWSFPPPDTSSVSEVRFHLLFLPLGAPASSEA